MRASLPLSCSALPRAFSLEFELCSSLQAAEELVEMLCMLLAVSDARAAAEPGELLLEPREASSARQGRGKARVLRLGAHGELEEAEAVEDAAREVGRVDRP